MIQVSQVQPVMTSVARYSAVAAPLSDTRWRKAVGKSLLNPPATVFADRVALGARCASETMSQAPYENMWPWWWSRPLLGAGSRNRRGRHRRAEEREL